MATINVSLPDAMKAWVEKQAESGLYGNASDYVRDLIRRDQRRAEALASLNAEIERGLASGPARPFDPERFRAALHAERAGRARGG